MAKTVPLMLATLLYAWQTVNFLLAGDFAFAAVFMGYALANLGLIAAAS